MWMQKRRLPFCGIRRKIPVYRWKTACILRWPFQKKKYPLNFMFFRRAATACRSAQKRWEPGMLIMGAGWNGASAGSLRCFFNIRNPAGSVLWRRSGGSPYHQLYRYGNILDRRRGGTHGSKKDPADFFSDSLKILFDGSDVVFFCDVGIVEAANAQILRNPDVHPPAGEDSQLSYPVIFCQKGGNAVGI